jgi:hypothetical protein
MEAKKSVVKAPAPPTDPNLAIEQQTATQQLAQGLQTQTTGDMASLMARYGTQLAIAGGTTSPLVSTRTGAIAPGKAP